MRYLTNHDPDDHKFDHDAMGFMVYVAALRSGQNVKYLTCPMPPDMDDYYSRNVKSGLFNHFGCVVGIDDEYDYSKFWREFDKLEDGAI